ncbi:MAG: hypothetical protein GTO18_05470 [Anaerolineales bacterium]|nr:hypothetical protein [Anaerolineales bacterium]
MTIRRAIVWILSIIFGLICAVATILLFDTTIEKFSIPSTFLIFISFASFAFIWLDFFLSTNYLRT